MAKVFEVWHNDERYGEFEFLDMAWQAICENWSDADGERISIIEKISDFDIVDKDEEVDHCYGLEKLTITVRDMNALLNGKKLYTQVNSGEYAVVIDYAGNND